MIEPATNTATEARQRPTRKSDGESLLRFFEVRLREDNSSFYDNVFKLVRCFVRQHWPRKDIFYMTWGLCEAANKLISDEEIEGIIDLVSIGLRN